MRQIDNNTGHFRLKSVYVVLLMFMFLGTVVAQGPYPSYDFSLVNSDGDMLYYRITSSSAPYTVAVTRCHDSVYHTLPSPTSTWEMGQPGFLYPVYDYDSLIAVPSSVNHGGVTYAVTSVDKEAFYNQKGMHTVILPTSVETIDTSAFYKSSLANIVMPNVKRIEYNAFCLAPLAQVDLPSTLTYIGAKAFSLCSIGEVDIPSGVEVLSKYAFIDNPITKITFHEGLREIGTAAFSPEFVDSLVFPSSLQSIDLYTYQYYFDDGMEILCEYVEFKNGEDPLYIKDYCFYHFGNLKTLILSNNIVSIGRSCFEKSGIENIIIPPLVNNIHWRCFADCDSLRNVVLPGNLTIIETAAFQNTPLLKEISLPASMTDIGSRAFAHNANVNGGLKVVNCYSEQPFIILNNTFNAQDTIFVRVPCGKTAAYQSASGWNSYSNLVFEECVGIEEHVSADFKVYPNPTDDVLFVELRGGAGIANVALYDLQGRVVGANNHSPLQDGTATLNVRNIPAGVYVLRVTDADGKEYHRKIVRK